MNKIYIETSVGELIDKITILEIKKKKISDENSVLNINKEYSLLIKSLESSVKVNGDLRKLWEELKIINLKLWEIEDGKRLAEKNQKFDKSFIELARNVYKFNDKRSQIKSEINKISGSNIKEIKKYTSY